MIRNKMRYICCAFFVMAFVTACGKKSEDAPITTDTVLIQADGSVLDYQVDSFDKAYYNISEYEQMLKTEIDAYNQSTPMPVNSTGKPLVSVKTVGMVQEASATAQTVLEFQSVDALCDYYKAYGVERTFYYGTVSEAIKQGYDVNNNLYVRKKDSFVAVTQEQIEKSLSRHILIVSGENLHIRFENKIIYSSKDVTLNEAKTEAVVTDAVISYFVFE